MASYFDVKPPSKANAELADLPGRENAEDYGRYGLMSPQVTRILDDLDLEDHSSSDDEEPDTRSEGERQDSKSKKNEDHLHKTKSSPLSSSTNKPHINPAPPRQDSGVGGRKHLARFHSLRSMLFASHIEDQMVTSHESEAESKWKAEHDQRKGLNRPKTPESPSRSPTKEGFGHKIGHKLKRLASKEPPTMNSIREDDLESTASDDEGLQATSFEGQKKWDEKNVSDGETIDHSDIEDIKRWASRRDPPSDGEGPRGRRKLKNEPTEGSGTHNSDHGSIGHDDVDDLLKYVSRKGPAEEVEDPAGYSDASTVSDLEGATLQDSGDSDGGEDADELVRWISRKEGPNAGPLKEKKNSKVDPTSSEDKNQGHAELMRWISRADDVSGESDVEGIQSAPTQPTVDDKDRQQSLAHGDVDDLVSWVKKKDNSAVGAQEVEKPSTEANPKKDTLTHEDVDELVSWVTKRNDSAQQDEKEIVKPTAET